MAGSLRSGESSKAAAAGQGHAQVAHVRDIADEDVLKDAVRVEGLPLCLSIPGSTNDFPILHALDKSLCREVSTKGDGACGLHAIFGTANTAKALELAGARDFILPFVKRPWEHVAGAVGLEARRYFEAVETSIWQEFAVPSLRGLGLPNEEAMFHERLQMPDHEGLRRDIARRVQDIDVSAERRDVAVAECRIRSASVFTFPLERAVWRRLAVEAGLLPDVERDFLCCGEQELRDLPKVNADFLEPAWEMRRGQLVARASSYPFVPDAYGGPLSKYAALFDTRSAFDALRLGFLTAVLPNGIDGVEQCLIDAHDIPESDLQSLFEYGAAWTQMQSAPLLQGPFEGFTARAWPVLVDCMSRISLFLCHGGAPQRSF